MGDAKNRRGERVRSSGPSQNAVEDNPGPPKRRTASVHAERAAALEKRPPTPRAQRKPHNRVRGKGTRSLQPRMASDQSRANESRSRETMEDIERERRKLQQEKELFKKDLEIAQLKAALVAMSEATKRAEEAAKEARAAAAAANQTNSMMSNPTSSMMSNPTSSMMSNPTSSMMSNPSSIMSVSQYSKSVIEEEPYYIIDLKGVSIPPPPDDEKSTPKTEQSKSEPNSVIVEPTKREKKAPKAVSKEIKKK
ncbi:hypothetical protein QR680_006065 [Steinernema hermaphroditum]|uniref:Uncharacterized protein n=1 Tax=Steinernema hermaphroditum TaxID=289476 RepID=A0AA39LWG4_9BILA|nr:hypothetical protein QR680_006065 [Steinernema hermaphroditum]